MEKSTSRIASLVTAPINPEERVTRAGLLEYAKLCREWAASDSYPVGFHVSRPGFVAQDYMLCFTNEGGVETIELLACAEVAESLALDGSK